MPLEQSPQRLDAPDDMSVVTTPDGTQGIVTDVSRLSYGFVVVRDGQGHWRSVRQATQEEMTGALRVERSQQRNTLRPMHDVATVPVVAPSQIQFAAEASDMTVQLFGRLAEHLAAEALRMGVNIEMHSRPGLPAIVRTWSAAS